MHSNTAGSGCLPDRMRRCSQSATTTSRSTHFAAPTWPTCSTSSAISPRPEAPVKLIKLEQNYRSHGHILDAANTLIGHNQARLGKNLWTADGKGEPVRAYVAPSDVDEAAFVVDVVKGLVDDGVSPAEIAVLYRSNAQSRVLEHALFNAGMPYRVYGGMRFFERTEVKHALAYLRLIAAPDDDGAFLRVANFPPRGIGARTLEVLQDRARATGTSLWQTACGAHLGGRAGAGVAAFVKQIEAMRAATAELPLSGIVEHVVQASGMLTHYGAEKDGQERIENLQELVNAAESFVREVERQVAGDAELEAGGALTAFLAHAALEAGETQAAEGHAALQLMTVHAAKGLEFHTVFVTGLEEGLFPHENSLSEFDGVEEERRLAYVAITRARRRLYLTHAQSRILHGQLRYNIASRFLDELPDGLVRWLSPQRADGLLAREVEQARRRGAARCAGGRSARVAHRPKRAARQVRSGHHHRCGRPRQRRAGAGELPRCRREMAGAGIRQASAGLIRVDRRRFVGMKDVAIRDVVGDL